jgi:hypothetical protein
MINLDKVAKIILLVFAISVSGNTHAQSFNTDKTALTNFLIRMYKHATFDIKVVEDYDNHYLVSAVILDPAKYGGSESTMLRVASVKAMSQASRYFNGSSITADLLITTKEDAEGNANTEIIEKIKENSIGYVNQLEHLSNFTNEEGKQVFLYMKQID